MFRPYWSLTSSNPTRLNEPLVHRDVRYWWANKNRILRQEIEGGSLWSPKRNRSGNRNPFYEFMRDVAR
jgi:hypothetical protein